MHLALFVLKLLFGPGFLAQKLFWGAIVWWAINSLQKRLNYPFALILGKWVIARLRHYGAKAFTRAMGVGEVEDFKVE